MKLFSLPLMHRANKLVCLNLHYPRPTLTVN